MRGLYVMNRDISRDVFSEETRANIASLLGESPKEADVQEFSAHPELLEGVEALFTSYGICFLDERILSHADRLKIVFHGGGTVKTFLGKEFFGRNFRAVSAARANAIPVAEFAVAEIILALKRFYDHSARYKKTHLFRIERFAGAYRSKVGIISYGLIAKDVIRLLRSYDVEICVYSPELTPEICAADGVRFATLEELFRICDVVSLHAPLLPETVGMIRREHFLSMKPHAAFVNTARGAIVDEAGMIEALREREDLCAILDVTEQEPPAEDSPLFALDNVVLTPHIAGAYFQERNRLGELIAEEVGRYVRGEPLRYEVTERELRFKA